MPLLYGRTTRRPLEQFLPVCVGMLLVLACVASASGQPYPSAGFTGYPQPSVAAPASSTTIYEPRPAAAPPPYQSIYVPPPAAQQPPIPAPPPNYNLPAQLPPISTGGSGQFINEPVAYWQSSTIAPGAAERLPTPASEYQVPAEQPTASEIVAGDAALTANQPWVPGTTNCWYDWNAKARSYYTNDQRIEFTGQEETFGVEGVLAGEFHQLSGAWEVIGGGELFLTQPFDQNVLVDTPERASFAANFEYETLSISQLHLGARKEDFYVAIGKMVTPFGKFYYENFFNNFDDSPFIRSEAVLNRETGLLTQWDPEGWVFTTALVNGSEDRDTNSTKAIIARGGIDRENFTCGVSVKWHDGIGSEGQKTYNNHVGGDMMLKLGRWRLSSELIYDQYGLRRPGLAPNDITWGRSLYYRDLNQGLYDPIEGVGYYLNLDYEGERITTSLNYGEYHPEQIGVPQHDEVNRRGLIKTSFFFTPQLELYGIGLIENTIANDFGGRDERKAWGITLGLQYSL